MKNIESNILSANNWLKVNFPQSNPITLEQVETRLKKADFLGTSSTKTRKGEKLNYLTSILYFAPYDICGINLCPFAVNCKDDCLFGSGHGSMEPTTRARIVKTLCYLLDKDRFVELLQKDINKAKKRADKLGFELAVRINGTSDLNVQLSFKSLLANNPDVIFYDYTKVLNYVKKSVESDYHLTFSFDGQNWNKCIESLDLGVNVSAVFLGELPNEYKGFKVINGDIHDLRFLDKKGVIVGLTHKRTNNKELNQEFIITDHLN